MIADSSQFRPSLRFLGLGLLPAFAVGAALRMLGLRDQVMTDDELHTLGAVLSMSPAEILSNISREGADYCVPLSALFRVLIDHGVVLGEMSFRLPSILAGLAALVAMPLLIAPRIGERAAVGFAWLLAISPMLVLYSRIARPYMLAALVAFAAVMAFDRWLRSRSNEAAACYVVLAALATWLHLGAGPLVVAPFALALFRALRSDRDRSNQLRSTLALGFATAVAIALPLLPAMLSLVDLLAIRRDGQLPTLATWLEVVPLQAGTRSTLLGFAMLALVLRGAWILRRLERGLFELVATVAALTLFGLLLLSPDRMQEGGVLNRYLIFLLPFGLALAALAISDAASLAANSATRALYGVCVVGLGMLLLVSGPLLRADYRHGSFTHTPSFLRLTQPPDWIPGDFVPPFYHELFSQDEDTVIVEHPWMHQATQVIAAYQNVHQREVLVSSLVEGHHDPRIALRNVLRAAPEDFLESRARFVVVHLDLRSEASHVVSPDPHFATWLKAYGPLWEPLRRAGRETAIRLERLWGRPFYRDDTIVVWDLDRVRAERIERLD